MVMVTAKTISYSKYISVHYSLKRWICRTCSKSSWLSFVKSEKKKKKKKERYFGERKADQ